MTFQIDANHAMARATSLVEAVKVAGEKGATDVLRVAHEFYSYITQESAPKAPVATGIRVSADATNITPPEADGTPRVPTPAAKPAKAKPAPKAAPAPAPAPASDVTKEQVGEIVSKLLAAQLREEAIGLLKKFKATSVSGVQASDYEAFVSEGKQILGDAAIAAQGEPEADLEA